MLKNNFKVSALIDTGTKIYFIIWEVIENARLVVYYGLKLELISYASHNWSFLGLFEDVEVAIGGLKIRNPIFDIKHRDYDLILGHSLPNLIKFSKRHKLNAIFDIIMHL